MASRRQAKSGLVKPRTLKEAIIKVLQEAGPGGLTVKQMVQRIKKKKWWDWDSDEAGYDSVSAACNSPIYRDIFVRVAPGTWSLWDLQDDDFTPYVKPMELKEAIIRVLQEAGPGGLTVREIVQRIKKKEWWDWENEKSGYQSVSHTCYEPRHRDIFACVAPGTFSLWDLQDDDFTPYVKPVKPMELKEAIIKVLQEAGPGGLTVREIVKRIKKKEWWDWKDDEQGYQSVRSICPKLGNCGVLTKLAPGVYAFKESLQEQSEGSSKKCTSCEEPDNESESSSVICEESCVSSKEDHEEEQAMGAVDMYVKTTTTLTASGRVSKAPSRLSSIEEWNRVMECPQLSKGGTKRARETAADRSSFPRDKPGRPRKLKKVEDCITSRDKPGRPRKMKKVEDCIRTLVYEYRNVEVNEDGRLVLFSDEYENSFRCVWT